MNYRETLDYLFSQLPMYQRIGAAAYKANLDATYAICRVLDHPENKFRSVHIAGTNGKGSTAHMLAAVFQSAGYKTGLYTSPHLKDFRERIRINGSMIPENEVIRFVEEHKKIFSDIQPSFFEWTVGLAFDHFAREKVEMAIIETGLGGRLDSTNVVQPEISVITNIGMDHSNLLGDTLEKIAGEKAGIIKQGVPVVIGEAQEATISVFTGKAAGLDAPLRVAAVSLQAVAKQQTLKGQRFDVFQKNEYLYKDLDTDLAGAYQRKNLVTVLQTIRMLRERGWQLPDEAVRTGLASVQALTGLKGRWNVIAEDPLTLADVGHNAEGIRETMKQIGELKYDQLHMVIGFVNDKDIGKVLELLPVTATYYFCKADIPRAMNEMAVKELAAMYGLQGSSFPSVREALKAARKNAAKNDLVFVGGSTFVVAEVL